MATQRWCRFDLAGRSSFGLIGDDRVIEVEGSPFEAHRVTSTTHALSAVKLLPPVIPPMIYVAGPNHRRHIEALAKRRGKDPVYPKYPEANFRSVHALVGTNSPIIIPKASSGRVQPEGQLVIIIGRRARNVSREQASDYIFGLSIGNDITERDWQAADRTMYRSKNTDTFMPFGPCIATGLDPNNRRIIVRYNGSVWQEFNSSEQMWDAATWVAELSRYSTLHPGDAIWMGTQGADGDMVAGDVIEVEIEGVGVLRNPLAAEI